MTDQFIRTPYYLDQYQAGVLALAVEGPRNEPSLPAGTAQTRIGAINQALSALVAQAIEQGQRPVSLAGDCLSAIGVLAGLQRAGIDPTLLWFDAHGDFNTWETTPSGFLGGMPLAMLVGLGDQTIVQAVGLTPLPASQVVLIGARDLDPGEQESLAVSEVVQQPEVTALLEAPLPAGPLYVHFDTDVLDPADAPAMNYRAPGGPNAETLGRVFHRLAQTERIVAVSMSVWNPELDAEGRTRAVCMDLLQTLLSHRAAS